MQDEGTQDGGLMLNGARASARVLGERVDVEVRGIGERVRFQIAPQVLDRIELRGIGRQIDGADVRLRGQKRLDDAGPVRLQPIPDQHPGRGQLPIELSKEGPDAERVDVGMGMKSEVQLHPIARGRDTHRGDRGDLLMGARALLEHRRDAARMPGAPDQRRHQQARFVDEDEIRSQARGVFFTRGQSVLTQRRISASSRSTARRVGFCGLQPRPRNRRPI